MSQEDARRLADGSRIEAEICIVGAGAAGITLARALAGMGKDVLLVEGGGAEPDEATQRLHDIDSIGDPVRPNYMARARQYGGTCNLWAGRNMRLLPLDFEERPWVAHSGWPIAPAEIESRLPAAAAALGLPPLAQLEAAAYRDRLAPAEAALLAAPELVPTVSLWGKRPMRFAAIHGKALRRDPRIRLLLHANLTRIETDDAGRTVTAMVARTLDGRTLHLRARHYVLACGGIENARLLLAADAANGLGIGLGRDWIGRCFMDHPRAVFGRVRLAAGSRLPHLRGLPLPGGKVQLGMALTEAIQRREGLLDHYLTFESEVSDYAAQTYEQAVSVAKVVLRRGHAGRRSALGQAQGGKVPGFFYLLTPKELLPHALFRWQTLLRDRFLQPRGEQRRVVVYFCEQPPDRASRVTLGSELDALDVPRPVLDWRIGGEVVRSLLRMQEVLGRVLEERGLGRLEPGDPDRIHFTDASHHMGTTRMSSGPETGVADGDGRVHGIGNLHLAGSSLFPTAGHANPTLTIVALALRLAEHLGRGRAS